ncbi:MAG: hypothetical protein SGJ02_03960 [bacterium]|nr:hypothetical protein [bacterium]
MDPITKIREKSREEWIKLVAGYLDEIRIWIEDNGVTASVIALVFGMIFILFFKLIVFLVVVAGLISFFVWSVAIPEAEKKQESSPKNGPNDSDGKHSL